MQTNITYMTALLISFVSLTGCQAKVAYLTPQITGQVIDKKTNLPIANAKTVIGGNAFDMTDKQGFFNVPSFEVEYVVDEPSYSERNSIGGTSFRISKSGYEYKSYANGGLAFVTSSDGQKRYVNMGKIYLMPVPVGREGEYKTHYLTLGYCKPTQSQKEVDCIPVPEGKTYEQVSPNKPVN